MAGEGEWWTIAQAAKRLDVSERTIKNYIAAGLPLLAGRVPGEKALEMYRRRIRAQRASRATRRSSA